MSIDLHFTRSWQEQFILAAAAINLELLPLEKPHQGTLYTAEGKEWNPLKNRDDSWRLLTNLPVPMLESYRDGNFVRIEVRSGPGEGEYHARIDPESNKGVEEATMLALLNAAVAVALAKKETP